MTPEEQLAAASRVLDGRDWFYFGELSPAAQARAVEVYNEGNRDDDRFEYPIEEAEGMLTLLGVHEPKVMFSGFSSQGDGACFTGFYRYSPGASKRIKEEWPKAEALHTAIDALQTAQHTCFYQLTAELSHRDRYYHKQSVSIDVQRSDGKALPAGVEDDVSEALRDIMRYIYRTLEEEEYQTGEGAYEYLNEAGYHYNEDGTETDE